MQRYYETFFQRELVVRKRCKAKYGIEGLNRTVEIIDFCVLNQSALSIFFTIQKNLAPIELSRR